MAIKVQSAATLGTFSERQAGPANLQDVFIALDTGQVFIPTGANVWSPTPFGKWQYSFAVDGGAVSTIPLRGDTIPSGAVIYGGFVDITTALTSGGSATIAANSEAAGDLAAATAVASWSTGRKNVLPALASGSVTANTLVVKTTAARVPAIAIATAALTAGIFNLYLLYVVL